MKLATKIKKNWWKIFLPIVIPIVLISILIISRYIKKREEVTEMLSYASKP